MRLGNLLLVLCVTALRGVLAVDPLVNLGYTKYQGTAQSNGISSWLGMRYAAPPLGDLRFRAPQDPIYNGTVQSATTNGPICFATGTGVTNTSAEDCLFLDVFAPSNATRSSKLPVYFWIQGGSYNANSNSDYRGDGLILASGMNIVVVTFNYRVGPFGFLASSEVTMNGDLNVGLLDQRKAMEWVQLHIRKFGGNPDHVTLGGASAGAGSIAMHLSAYGGRNDGLFHAGAGESPFFLAMLTVPESQYQYDALVQRVGCANTTDTLYCLRQVNSTYLQMNNIGIPYPGSGVNASAPRSMYAPVIDGVLIEDYIDHLYADGKFMKVPVIFGDDTNEGTIFTPTNTSSYEEMDQWLKDQYPSLTSDQLTMINSLYPEGLVYNGTGAFYESVSYAYGAMCMICPGISIVSAVNAYSTHGAWSYRYNVLDPVEAAAGLGVPHTIEVNAIWGPEYTTGGAPASYYTTNAAIIPVIQSYWASFIRTYNPNTYRMAGTPKWKQWSQFNQDRLLFVTNATTMEMVSATEKAQCAYLSSISVMGG